MKQLSTCDLCGSSKLRFLFEREDEMHNIPGRYTLWRCEKCGLLFVNPQPEGEELSKHYPKDEYYSLKGNTVVGKAKTAMYRAQFSMHGNPLVKILTLPFKPFLRATKIVPGGRFLDVGAGRGEFMSLMKEFDWEVTGTEPEVFDKDYVEENKLDIREGFLEDIHFPDDHFDVITVNHVFEHVSSPMTTLKELKRILKPGGTLIIGVPNSDSTAYKRYGKYWFQLDIPRHLFTFSVSTLKQYAEKTGMDIEKIRFTGRPPAFLASRLYKRNAKKEKKTYLSEKSFAHNKLLFILYMPYAYITNWKKQGDQVEVFLTKEK